jgi:S-adenosylmethionine:tRNA ribosyltransferase-isomerase
MKPASWLRDKREDRLLVLDAETSRLDHARFTDLARYLRAGDVMVVNDAATIPAAWAFTRAGEPGELRVLLFDGANGLEADAVVLGTGSMRERTESRRAARASRRRDALAGRCPGARDRLRGATRAAYACASTENRKLRALYGFAKPIQYAYVERPLALYNVVLPYAGRPWASEMPSAGAPSRLRGALAAARGRRSRGGDHPWRRHRPRGDAALDRELPFPERYQIGERAADVIEAARATGRRVVAVGTSVVRALESAARASRTGASKRARPSPPSRVRPTPSAWWSMPW